MSKIAIQYYTDDEWSKRGYKKLSRKQAKQITEDYGIDLKNKVEFSHTDWEHVDWRGVVSMTSRPKKTGEWNLPIDAEDKLALDIEHLFTRADKKNKKIYRANRYNIRIIVSDIEWSERDADNE